MTEDDWRTVAGNFNDIVSRVRMRLGEEGDDDFIDTIARGGID
jgi:DNA-binding winged helix-turn-helix (wHTH) protein